MYIWIQVWINQLNFVCNYGLSTLSEVVSRREKKNESDTYVHAHTIKIIATIHRKKKKQPTTSDNKEINKKPIKMHELGQLHADHVTIEFACGTTNLPCCLFAWTKDVKRGKNQIKWIWISFKFQLLPSNVYFHLPYLRKRHCYWFLFLSISLYQDGNFDQCLTQINKRQNWWRDAAKVIIFCCWKNRKEKIADTYDGKKRQFMTSV